jgi:hypothetical protein
MAASDSPTNFPTPQITEWFREALESNTSRVCLTRAEFLETKDRENPRSADSLKKLADIAKLYGTDREA